MNKPWTYLFALVLVLAIGLVVLSCGDDDKIQEPASPITADFYIYETLPIALPESWEYMDTDTVLTNHVIFSAAYEGVATYEWQLGAETIHEKSFSRWDFPRGEFIEVSLKISKTVGDSVMIDSLTRYFYTIEDRCEELSYLDGSYEGYYEGNEAEKRIIEFEYCHFEDITSNPDPDPISTVIKITNVVDECSMYFNSSLRTYKQIYLASGGPLFGVTGCQSYNGYLRFDVNGKIEFDLRFWFGELDGQKRKFYGTKLQN